MTIIHGVAVVITVALFIVAAVAAETDFGPHAREIVAGWVMAGVVLAPLVTAITAIWWISGQPKEAIPARPEPGPYAVLSTATSSMERISA
ncbi:hypothetical protein F8O01_02725 [Pseudoclavibacter chungangensis]|uniref:Uncharacterized protein n=2 Tax=Pseudoclavibacter chungangensis TaxID=587635 RepID=A0A7J5C2E1_9MICO|nr:hypothetical protein F8O01_02725 [Pseudoclavibacter chungangensis]